MTPHKYSQTAAFAEAVVLSIVCGQTEGAGTFIRHPRGTVIVGTCSGVELLG